MTESRYGGGIWRLVRAADSMDLSHVHDVVHGQQHDGHIHSDRAPWMLVMLSTMFAWHNQIVVIDIAFFLRACCPELSHFPQTMTEGGCAIWLFVWLRVFCVCVYAKLLT